MSDVDIHEHTRHAYAEEDLDDDARTHLDGCEDCRTWTRRLDRILAAASDTYPRPAPARSIETIAALGMAEPATMRRRRAPLLAAAAAVAAAVIAAGAIMLIRERDQDGDVLAEAATALRQNSAGTRFVYDADAVVNVIDDPGPIEATALSVSELPDCTAGADTQPAAPATLPGRNVDLEAALDALTTTDPCEGLRQLRATIGPATTTSLQQLADTEAHAARILEQLDATDPATSLQAASAAALREQTEQVRSTAAAAAERVAADANTAADSLQQYATAAASGDDTTPYQTSARSSITALVDTLDEIDTAAELTTAVAWEQLATGTWQPNADIAVDGSTNVVGGAELPFRAAADDPLGLAGVILADPDTLTAVLDAGPDTDDPTVTYEIPAAMLPANPLDVERWTVTVTTDEGSMRELELTAVDPSSESSLTIIVTPARPD